MVRGKTEGPVLGVPGDWTPHVELTVCWSPKNVQHVLVLMDTRAKLTLIYSNPDHFQDPPQTQRGMEVLHYGLEDPDDFGYWVLA